MKKRVAAGLVPIVLSSFSCVKADEVMSYCTCQPVSSISQKSFSPKNNTKILLPHTAKVPRARIKKTAAFMPHSVVKQDSHAAVPQVSESAPVQTNAAVSHPALYLGVSAGRMGQSHYSHSTNTGRIYGGYQFSDQLGIESGYFNSAKWHQGNSTDKHQGVDILAVYRPTNVLPGFYAKAGLAYEHESHTSVQTEDRVTHSKYTYRDRPYPLPLKHIGGDRHIIKTTIDNHTDDHIDMVLGMGYELALTQHLGLDVSYMRYQDVKHSRQSKGLNLFSVGARYAF